MKLWERELHPKQVSMSEVNTVVRACENDVSLLEQMQRTNIDTGMKYYALLKLIPTHLSNLAKSQQGIGDNYNMLRDYVLNQSTHHRMEPTDMDIGRLGFDLDNPTGEDVPEDAGGELLFSQRAGPKGRGKGKTKSPSTASTPPSRPDAGARGTKRPGERPGGPQCWNCHGCGHLTLQCPTPVKKSDKESYQLEHEERILDESADDAAEVYSMFTLRPDPDDLPVGLLQREDQSLDALGMTSTSNGRMKLTSYLDSGAARSVCPRGFGSHFGLTSPVGSQSSVSFRTATGVKVPKEGDRTIRGWNPNGRRVSMKYAVADTSVALDSVSQICDHGATVLFTRSGGLITGPNGEKTEVRRVGHTYIREIWVDPPSAGFTRPGPQDS